MIAHFDSEGPMTHMAAKSDGDLTTPYHGSGEHVTRGDYRRVGNQMIPHSFTISRAAKGKIFSFWKGKSQTSTLPPNPRGEHPDHLTWVDKKQKSGTIYSLLRQ